MGHRAVKVYSYIVEVLAYSTDEGKIRGPRKALADQFYKYRVIARNKVEAEQIGREMCKRGGELRELEVHASVVQCLAGCHSASLP